MWQVHSNGFRAEVVNFSDAFSATVGDGNDQPVGFKVMSELCVTVWDDVAKARRTVPMRWGYPRRGNWRAPHPIHARSETIDRKPNFADAFHNAQRGIILVKIFNEGKWISPKVTEQYTIMLGDDPAGAIASDNRERTRDNRNLSLPKTSFAGFATGRGIGT